MMMMMMTVMEVMTAMTAGGTAVIYLADKSAAQIE